MSLEGEPCDIFDDVTVRQAHPMRVPVQLQVAQSHLRITTVSPLVTKQSTPFVNPLSDEDPVDRRFFKL